MMVFRNFRLSKADRAVLKGMAKLAVDMTRYDFLDKWEVKRKRRSLQIMIGHTAFLMRFQKFEEQRYG